MVTVWMFEKMFEINCYYETICKHTPVTDHDLQVFYSGSKY